MSKLKIHQLLAGIVVGAPGLLHADLRDSLDVPELTPFSQIYPAHRSFDATDAWQIALQYDLANTQIYETKADESMALDLEYERRSITFERGFGEDWAISISVARGAYREGSTDAFIERWHDTFGLPNGARDKYPQDLIALRFARAAESAIDIQESQSALLDTHLQVSKRLNKKHSLGVWATVPTGNEKRWLGADGVNLGVAWSYTSAFSDMGTWFASIGGMKLADSPSPLLRNKDFATRFTLGGSWLLNESAALKLQMHGHTAFYDSDLAPLGDDALVLVMGGTVRLSEEWLLDISVTEDLAVDASPDVGFHMRLTWHSGRD
ncbi:DUF3187 family protein [Aequoribacter sp.]|uniref:DUF3187 family protein n=1 Tax=Aequoribacter sp. TaxID=2847771 RepID=UPI003F69E575